DIERLPFDMKPLQAQLREHAPEIVADMLEDARRQGNKPTEDAILTVLSGVALASVKGIPGLAKKLVAGMNDRRIPMARRCTIASVLGYLVQPRDLLPDNLPGGYGFLDDAAMLRAGVVECLQSVTPGQSLEDEQRAISILVAF